MSDHASRLRVLLVVGIAWLTGCGYTPPVPRVAARHAPSVVEPCVRHPVKGMWRCRWRLRYAAADEVRDRAVTAGVASADPSGRRGPT